MIPSKESLNKAQEIRLLFLFVWGGGKGETNAISVYVS